MTELSDLRVAGGSVIGVAIPDLQVYIFARSFVDPSFGWRPTISGELDIRLIPARTGSVIQDPEAVPVAAAELSQIIQQIAMARR